MPWSASLNDFSELNDDLVFARDDVDAAAFAVELDRAIDQREERVVAALADAFAGVELCTQLTDDDVAGDDLLAAVSLHTAALTVGIATVAAGALTFFMCHDGPTSELNRRSTRSRPCG